MLAVLLTVISDAIEARENIHTSISPYLTPSATHIESIYEPRIRSWRTKGSHRRVSIPWWLPRPYVFYIRTTNFVFGVNTGPDACVPNRGGADLTLAARRRDGDDKQAEGKRANPTISPYLAAPPVFSLHKDLKFRILHKWGPKSCVPIS